jgi:Na+/H+ antiporter NhaD/arsenite permease-like protein
MELLLAVTFIVGYTLIALEHPLRINKAATAVVTGILSWVFLLVGHAAIAKGPQEVEAALMHHLGETASILFFLLGAMTIVEVVDSYDGFQFIIRLLRVKSLWVFLVIVVLLTFFLSAVIDNLTSTIVMASIFQKVIPPENRSARLLGISLIVLAANSGGAWSPIGDVTTTMLWIKERITEVNIVRHTFLPSLVSVLVPMFVVGRLLRGTAIQQAPQRETVVSPKVSLIVFAFGIGGILSVPLLKIFLHIPPFAAMLGAMGMVWLLTEILYRRLRKTLPESPEELRVEKALSNIDSPSLLFFLGILLAVGALSEVGLLRDLADFLIRHLAPLQVGFMDGMDLVIYLMGILSAIIDNVPLVAVVIEMFPLSQFPTDHHIWEFLAYTAGVGGNLLIIGSAAGVVAMGLENIEFFWYLRRISWLAFIGYTMGALTYLLLV